MSVQDQNFWIFLCFDPTAVDLRSSADATRHSPSKLGSALAAPALPLLVGEVVRSEYGGICGHANSAINDITNLYPNTFVVSSEGCLPCEDYLHFSSEGYRLLGRRYALRYLEVTNPQLAEVYRQKYNI